MEQRFAPCAQAIAHRLSSAIDYVIFLHAAKPINEFMIHSPLFLRTLFCHASPWLYIWKQPPKHKKLLSRLKFRPLEVQIVPKVHRYTRRSAAIKPAIAAARYSNFNSCSKWILRVAQPKRHTGGLWGGNTQPADLLSVRTIQLSSRSNLLTVIWVNSRLATTSFVFVFIKRIWKYSPIYILATYIMD